MTTRLFQDAQEREPDHDTDTKGSGGKGHPYPGSRSARMTIEQWTRIAALHIIAKWPSQPFPKASLAAWYDDLARFDANEVEFALRHYGRESKWRPELAELVRRLRFEETRAASLARAERARAIAPPEAAPATSDEAAAWLRVARAAARCGPNHPLTIEFRRQRDTGDLDVAALERLLAAHPPMRGRGHLPIEGALP